MNTPDRLLQVIAHLKISKNKFSTKLLGLSASTKVDNILKGKNDISPEFAAEICKVVPGLNYNWLYKGEGEMMMNPTKQVSMDRIVFGDKTELAIFVLQNYQSLCEEFDFLAAQKEAMEQEGISKFLGTKKFEDIVESIIRIKTQS